VESWLVEVSEVGAISFPFDRDAEGWTLSPWRSGPYDPGTIAWEPSGEAEHLARVRGVVTASDTGFPVPEYFLQSKEQESEDTHISSKVQRIKNLAGAFLLEGLKPGTYRLGVKAQGYAIHWQEIQLGAGKEEESLQIRLERGSYIRVRVVTVDTGEPVAGARINYISASKPLIYSTEDDEDLEDHIYREFVTSEDGSSTVDSLTEDNYSLHASRDGFFPDKTMDVRVDIPADAGKEFKLLLLRGGKLSGRIMNISKVETSGPRFWLVLQEVPTTPHTFEELFPVNPADGSFTSDDLRPGTYKIFLEKQAPKDKNYTRVSRRLNPDSAENRGREKALLGTVEIEPGKTKQLELRAP
jgi:hypothetical protein